MHRRIPALFALLFGFGILSAEEYSSKVVKVDAEAKEITIQVEGKDKVFPIDKTATYAKKGKGNKEKELQNGLKGVKKGADVTVSTDKRDGVEVVTKVLLGRKKAKE